MTRSCIKINSLPVREKEIARELDRERMNTRSVSYRKREDRDEITLGQQVMGLSDEGKLAMALIPKFKFDGGSPAKFIRDFPVVAKAFGVQEAYEWDPTQQLTPEQEELDNRAILVLRHYLTEDILQVLSFKKIGRAAAMMQSLRSVFLANNARTRVQVQKEMHTCEQRLGESLMEFLARVSSLLSELEAMGEETSEEAKIITVVTRLRQPLRQAAEDKLDRQPDITMEQLISFLVLKEKCVIQEDTIASAYMAQRKRYTGPPTCWTCGQPGHVQRNYDKTRCYKCGKVGHMAIDCQSTHSANMAVEHGELGKEELVFFGAENKDDSVM
jgi:hypothetical protein